MPNLTSYLQAEFARHCPAGWVCHHEAPILTSDLEEVLGYAPRADVLLERRDRQRRLWVEFEVSRADPVANHAKFATAHLFQPQQSIDTFLSMVSPHVNRGRRNLAANTILLMREIGMNAFQTVLLPHKSAAEIKRLNYLDMHSLQSQHLPIKAELDRLFAVSDAILVTATHRIHLAGDILEVMLNLRRWNQELATQEGRALWNRRIVTYFVYDPKTADFAPSKFCAYVPIPSSGSLAMPRSIGPMRTEMTVNLYVTLDGTDSRFDGHRARVHLTDGLAMTARAPLEAPDVLSRFDNWSGRNADSIAIHPSGPVFLLPPAWFT